MTSNVSDLVKVKPLEWMKAPEHLDCAWIDDFGLYQITDEDVIILFVAHNETGQIYQSLEAAKAAAQADYEARIVAALTPAERPEQCFSVRGGYLVSAWGRFGDQQAPLSEALSIRSVEDVRKESADSILKKIEGYLPEFGAAKPQDDTDRIIDNCWRDFQKVVLKMIDASTSKKTEISPTVAEAAKVLLGDDIALSRMAKAMHDGPLGADEYEYRADTKQGEWCLEMVRAGLRALAAQTGEKKECF